MKLYILLFISISFITLTAAVDQEDDQYEEYGDVVIHSELPLWGTDDDELWPKSYSDDDTFGCANRVRMGDWRLSNNNNVQDDEHDWVRFNNGGVFHCSVRMVEGYEQESLKFKDGRISFFIELGSIDVLETKRNLWIIQIGTYPGSDYWFLLENEETDEVLKSFDILQRSCSEKYIKEGPELDVFITEYCSINSKKELVKLAKQMALKKPLGTLIYQPKDNKIK